MKIKDMLKTIKVTFMSSLIPFASVISEKKKMWKDKRCRWWH